MALPAPVVHPRPGIIWAKELLDAADLKQLRDLPAIAKRREVFLGPFKVLVVQLVNR